MWAEVFRHHPHFMWWQPQQRIPQLWDSWHSTTLRSVPNAESHSLTQNQPLINTGEIMTAYGRFKNRDVRCIKRSQNKQACVTEADETRALCNLCVTSGRMCKNKEKINKIGMIKIKDVYSERGFHECGTPLNELCSLDISTAYVTDRIARHVLLDKGSCLTGGTGHNSLVPGDEL